MSRTSMFVATQSIIFATLSIIVIAIAIWNPIAAIVPLWHSVVACLSIAVYRKSRQAAHLKAVVPSDLEFSIWYSILFMLSVEQFVVSLGVAWEAVTEYKWSDASEGAAAFCFLLAAVASLAAAGMGLLGGARHVLSNEDVLVRVAVLTILHPVMAFIERCTQEYVHACMHACMHGRCSPEVSRGDSLWDVVLKRGEHR
jgi:hypothetical protein